MKLKSGFLLRSIAGSHVVVPVGSRSVDFNGMMTLNDTGAFLWKQLEKGAEEEELVRALIAACDGPVDEDAARSGVRAFLKELQSVDCLEF